MTTFIRSAIFAGALLAGLSAAQARYYDLDQNGRTPSQYNLNSPSDVRAFWDNQTRNGN
jgi:hypothetical protein